MPTIAEVKFAACRYYNTTQQALTGPSRRHPGVHHRMVAMTVCRAATDKSMATIGRSFGGRDHATVLSATRRVMAHSELTAQAAAVLALVEDGEWMRMTAFRDWTRDVPFRSCRKWHEN